MTELVGALWLVSGLALLGGAAILGACCFKLKSLAEFVVTAYTLAWAWLVVLAYALSPLHLLSRAYLVAVLAAGFVAAALCWHASGRPRLPQLRAFLNGAGEALRHPANRILAIVVGLGALYTVGLALFVPQNDGDALTYHLARAAFWKQHEALGYVPNAGDSPLNGHPPNAEIGQLAAMVLSQNDRYVALPQLFAYMALVLSVALLARRLDLSRQEALFAALVFGTFPIVAVQASTALNDLVVASFLAIATVFVLQRQRAALILFALALGLALGTKLVAVLALPTIALVAAAARPRREWAAIAVSGIVGCAIGSWWYLLNLVETGELDGGLFEELDHTKATAGGIVTTVLRLMLDLVDLSGGPWPHRLLFVVGALVLAALAISRLHRSKRQALGLAAAAALTASVLLVPLATGVGQDFVFRAWVAMGRPPTAPFEQGWKLNVEADPALSWYGPLGSLLVTAGGIAVAAGWKMFQRPRVALVFVLAPWMLLLTIAAVVEWDPLRGRFLMYGVALAAAASGALLRHRAAAGAAVAIGTTSIVLSLTNYAGKPSGLGAIWPRGDPAPTSAATIWGADRVDAQTWLRPRGEEYSVLRYVEDNVPTTASLAVAPGENIFLSPYFGERLERHVQLVPNGGRVPADAEWLVVPRGARVRRCEGSWRNALRTAAGWQIEHREQDDRCFLE